MKLRYFNRDGEVARFESYSHPFIDPENGALYCPSDAYRKTVEAAGYKYVKMPATPRLYPKIRNLLDAGKTEEAERVFYTWMITGEV